MTVRRHRPYVALIADSEGVTHHYVFTATSRRRAAANADEWADRWGETLVGIKRAEAGTGRRLLAVAAVAFAVSGTTIAVLMIVGLSLEGAL
jgi:hypothetical protein